MGKTIEQILAEAEIRDVQARYCRSADRCDFELYRTCFHDDAVLEFSFWTGGVDEFIGMAEKMLSGFVATTHFTGNQSIRVEGDSARCEFYTLATHRIAADDKGPERDYACAVRYIDRMERRGGEWRIARRNCVLDWARSDPVPEFCDGDRPARRGATGAIRPTSRADRLQPRNISIGRPPRTCYPLPELWEPCLMNGACRLASLCVLAIGALALAACDSSDKIEAENESVESVAAKVASSDLRPSPGRWESRMKIVEMKMPGMSPEMQGMMKDQLGKAQTSVSCLTKEEAEKSEEEFFKPPEATDCKYNKFSMGGGRIEADMTCNEQGASQNMKMTGTYAADAYAMQVSTDGNMGGQKMSMAMEIEARRVGDCDGSEKG